MKTFIWRKSKSILCTIFGQSSWSNLVITYESGLEPFSNQFTCSEKLLKFFFSNNRPWKMSHSPPVKNISGGILSYKHIFQLNVIQYLIQANGSFEFLRYHVLRLIPYGCRAIICDVGLAGGDHLICNLRRKMILPFWSIKAVKEMLLFRTSARSYLDKKGGDFLRGVVITGDAVDHPNGIYETGNGFHHRYLYNKTSTSQRV